MNSTHRGGEKKQELRLAQIPSEATSGCRGTNHPVCRAENHLAPWFYSLHSQDDSVTSESVPFGAVMLWHCRSNSTKRGKRCKQSGTSKPPSPLKNWRSPHWNLQWLPVTVCVVDSSDNRSSRQGTEINLEAGTPKWGVVEIVGDDFKC